MVYAKAHCFNCNADFEIYGDDVFNQAKLRLSCPHCCAIIPQNATDKMASAFMALEEVNKTLRVAHEIGCQHLFDIELHNHFVCDKIFARGLNNDADTLSEREEDELCGDILDGLDFGSLDDIKL